MSNKLQKLLIVLLTCSIGSLDAAGVPKRTEGLAVVEKNARSTRLRDTGAVLWREPTDIGSRNLFYGAGGSEHQPQGPFVFVEEEKEGTNPKFIVRDARGVT